MNSPKYNRTLHFPWSPGKGNDDKVATSVVKLLNQPIVITEKMDGSNTSLEFDGCFARTHAGAPTHASFDGLKALHASIQYKIPKEMQFFGEWCFARHSIAYEELPGHFMLFNVRDFAFTDALWSSWDDVEIWAEELGVPTVPVLFEGQVGSEKELKELVESLMTLPSHCGGIREGVVASIKNS